MHFGETGGAGGSVAVPEPRSLLLLGIAAIYFGRQRGWGKQHRRFRKSEAKPRHNFY
jgi:hypothetical protein